MVLVQKLALRKQWKIHRWRLFLLAHALALAFLVFYLLIALTFEAPNSGNTLLSTLSPSTPLFPHLFTTHSSLSSQLHYGAHQPLLLLNYPPSSPIPASASPPSPHFFDTHSSLTSDTNHADLLSVLLAPPPPSVLPISFIRLPIPDSSIKSTFITAPYITISRPKSAVAASCKLEEGRWVLDKGYPLYPPSSCPYVDESFSCHRNGRSDLNYTRWRWQPHACHLPRLNGVHLLERLRGKRLVFVGDSLNRNQYQSMACLLRQAIPKSKRAGIQKIHRDKTSRAAGSYGLFFKRGVTQDYRFRLEFYRANFLVQEKQMVAMDGKLKETLKLDSMNRMWVKWKNAHILVFNTGHWWTHWKTDQGHNYFEERSKVHRSMKLSVAFTKAVKTWANWVDTHVNTSTTRVFFRSYSPSHFSGGQWNSGGQCDNESLPIFNTSYLNPFPNKMKVVQEIIKRMKNPVKILNVTRLSDFRKDGHPSIYGRKLEEHGNNMFQDCSHWCLPGLPDLWNEILYAQIIKPNYYI